VNTVRTDSAISRELEAIVGSAHIQQGVGEVGGMPLPNPADIVEPGGDEEIAAILRIANERGLVVVPAGGCTSQTLGRVPHRVDIVLKTTRLAAVEHYDPGDLTIGVQAGARVFDVLGLVASNRQLLPLDPPALNARTIGGALATAAHGPLRHRFGGVREFCVGLRYVTADGTIAKAGGKVVKNVAGYDVTKLMIGSHGTLAVLTAANFRLFPAPRRTQTFVCSFESVTDLVGFRDRLVASPLAPFAVELLSPEAARSVELESAWTLLVQAGGSELVLARYRRELGEAAGRVIEGESEPALWHSVREHARAVAARNPLSMVVSVSLPLASVHNCLQTAQKIADSGGYSFACVGCAHGALSLIFEPKDAQSPASYAGVIAQLRSALPPDASAVVTHCATDLKNDIDIWGRTATDLPMMQAVKRALDPKDILNRGRYLL